MKMGAIGCPAASVTSYQPTPRNVSNQLPTYTAQRPKTEKASISHKYGGQATTQSTLQNCVLKFLHNLSKYD
jgi:hypothetical protein